MKRADALQVWSSLLALLLAGVYVRMLNLHPRVWGTPEGLRLQPWRPYIKLSYAACVMVAIMMMSTSFATLAAGWLPNPEEALATTAGGWVGGCGMGWTHHWSPACSNWCSTTRPVCFLSRHSLTLPVGFYSAVAISLYGIIQMTFGGWRGVGQKGMCRSCAFLHAAAPLPLPLQPFFPTNLHKPPLPHLRQVLSLKRPASGEAPCLT